VLLAPLPSEAMPRRQPVASPEVLARPEGASIAGWEQLTVELSAGAAGLRIVMVVLDDTGQPIAASDGVLYRVEVAKGVIEYYHENVGGRLESDGTFRGARWRAVVVETKDGEEQRLETPPSAPSPADVSVLKALVAEVLRRSSQAA
jgi:hypothetical protein